MTCKRAPTLHAQCTCAPGKKPTGAQTKSIWLLLLLSLPYRVAEPSPTQALNAAMPFRASSSPRKMR